MKEVKFIWPNEINTFIEFMKTSETYKSEGTSHDADINGFHIYLYEGGENGGGIIHINKLCGDTK
ncbi:MAG: hypothetical protein WC834_00005 [Eubacteriales bacterium]